MSLSTQQIASCLPRLRDLIDQWESKNPSSSITPNNARTVTSSDSASSERSERNVITAFRTRPMLPGEGSRFVPVDTASSNDETIDPDDYLCEGISIKNTEPGVTVAHVPSMKWNGPSLNSKSFDSDLAFGPNAKDEDVYRMTVSAHGLIPLALAGGVVCVLAYGQTGTGKTYSMTSLQQSLARDLFDHAAKFGSDIKSEVAEDSARGDTFEITATFMEILGKAVYDLAADDADSDTRKPVKIAEDKLGKVCPDLVSTRVRTAAELESIITRCLSYRRTSATARNATSSRSHALLTIRVKNLIIPALEDGEFHLVDLAGSERYEDSKGHSKQLMDESRENNKSLLALKECVRARARAGIEDGFVHIPYRTSRLTWVLKPLFDLESTRSTKTLFIAHVSPHIQDISHSVNTLSYAAPFRILPPRRPPAPYDAEDPRTWDRAASIEWLAQAFWEQRMLRRDADWARQDKHARNLGRRVRPAPPTFRQDQDCLVDLQQFCPAPQGGMDLARVYGAEWVQKCLQQRNPRLVESKGEDAVCEAIMNDALGVYLAFNQMLVWARTRSRKELMNSRKIRQYDVEDTTPEPEDVLQDMPEQERIDFLSVYDQATLGKMIRQRVVDGGSSRTARHDVHTAAIAQFRQSVEKAAREKAKLDLETENWSEEWMDFIDVGF